MSEHGHGGVLVYRCRQCGGEDRSTHVPDVGLAVALAAAGARFPADWGGLSLGLTEAHRCGPGRVGITDLIGGVADGAEGG